MRAYIYLLFEPFWNVVILSSYIFTASFFLQPNGLILVRSI